MASFFDFMFMSSPLGWKDQFFSLEGERWNKISERKFSLSVHGANSCNSCHWDITDINTHFRPSKFPIDTVIFTGRFPKYELVEERSEQYERMLAEGTLETCRDKYPSVATDLFSEFVGFAMLAIGLLCIFLIAWEFLG